MPSRKRYKTDYPGVTYIKGLSAKGKPEKIYYIRYYKDGKQVEEKAGRQYKDDMSPARANQLKSKRSEGGQLSNNEQRKNKKEKKFKDANKWTIDRLWKEYKKLNPIKGITSDENRYKNYLEELFGNKEPCELIPLDIDRLRVKLLKTKKPATVKNVLELLRRIINFGVKSNLCDQLRFIIKMPTVNNTKTEDLNPKQLRKLFEVLDKESNKFAANFMKMALFTGMRRGELFNLKWNDIDFKRGFVYIRDPKGGADQNIPLNPEAEKILKNHERKESSYVFPGRDGQKRIDIKKTVNRIKREADLPEDFRPLHGLRHVYATMLASSGQVDMYTLQKLLTHKSPAMTQRYAHLRDDTLKNAANLAGELIVQSIKKKKDKVVGIKK
jgi:integrase